LVESRSWNFKLERLSIEDLVIVEAWARGVKAELLSRDILEVSCTLLLRLKCCVRSLAVLQAGDLILNSENGVLVVDV